MQLTCPRMTPIRWGIVGPGGIAEKFVADLRVAGGGTARAVVSRNMDRAKSAAAKFGAEFAFDNIEALAAEDSVDVVYIATPHQAHCEAAKFLLESGKPVLLEKPLTVNATQARELVQIARARGVFLMEALWTRFLPIYQVVRDWLNEGRIGRVRWVDSSFCVRGDLDHAKRWMNPHLAGGSLLDLGIYCLAMTQFVLKQKPAEIAAAASISSTGVDEMLTVSLGYGSGTLAGFVCGFVAGGDNRLIIAGEEGRVEIPAHFIAAQKAVLVRGSEVEVSEKPFNGGGFEYEIAEAHRCLRDGDIESPLMPLEDTLRNLETMDAIREKISLKYPFE